IGIGELALRYVMGGNETRQLERRLLPEDEQTVLRKRDLGALYRGIRAAGADGEFWMQRLLRRSILSFQLSGSTAQVNAVFNATLDLCQHELDLRYNLLKYLVWLIPTLGFIGTVVGIAFALRSAGVTFAAAGVTPDLAQLGPQLMQGLTKELGVAFYTTLLALLQSAVLMFALHLIQGREENALNRVGQYCLDNLINRLYEE
ncbi:MAG: MotA/TolQ/ExbB proton channel family protein, partial [Gammaproteobacteria bacterium]